VIEGMVVQSLSAPTILIAASLSIHIL
jgi:hypothetical protein